MFIVCSNGNDIIACLLCHCLQRMTSLVRLFDHVTVLYGNRVEEMNVEVKEIWVARIRYHATTDLYIQEGTQ